MYVGQLLESLMLKKGATALRYSLFQVPVEDSEGQKFQPCMIPIILGNSFANMQFHLQVMIKDHYVTLYITPVLIKVVNQSYILALLAVINAKFQYNHIVTDQRFG